MQNKLFIGNLSFKLSEDDIRELLANNELLRKTGAELAQVFAAIPESVTSIDLGSNKLSDEQIIQILISLPAWVNKVNFWDANTYEISDHVEHQMTVAKNLYMVSMGWYAI